MSTNVETQDLSLAATAVFGGSDNTPRLRSGRELIIRPAKTKQLPMVIRFFERVILSIDAESLGALVEMFADRQREAIAEGQDPKKIPLEEMSGVELVTKAFGKVSLFTQLFIAVADELPTLAETFTNLSAEEYGDLDADEGMLVAAGIFMQNYDFFSRTLPPILTAFMQSRAGSTPVIAQAAKTIRRKR